MTKTCISIFQTLVLRVGLGSGDKRLKLRPLGGGGHYVLLASAVASGANSPDLVVFYFYMYVHDRVNHKNWRGGGGGGEAQEIY